MLAICAGTACSPREPAPAPRTAAPAVSVAKPAPAPANTTAAPDADLPARAPAAAEDAGSCRPLYGEGVVSRGSDRYVEAKTPSECMSCSGAWGPHGLSGAVGCLCGTPDAGKPCDGPHDCVAECLVDEPGARDLAGSCPALRARFPAHCAPRYTNFGCHGIVVEKSTPAGPVRGVQYLCLD